MAPPLADLASPLRFAEQPARVTKKTKPQAPHRAGIQSPSPSCQSSFPQECLRESIGIEAARSDGPIRSGGRAGSLSGSRQRSAHVSEPDGARSRPFGLVLRAMPQGAFAWTRRRSARRPQQVSRSRVFMRSSAACGARWRVRSCTCSCVRACVRLHSCPRAWCTCIFRRARARTCRRSCEAATAAGREADRASGYIPLYTSTGVVLEREGGCTCHAMPMVRPSSPGAAGTCT